jgi:hypothetical protein
MPTGITCSRLGNLAASCVRSRHQRMHRVSGLISVGPQSSWRCVARYNGYPFLRVEEKEAACLRSAQPTRSDPVTFKSADNA